MWHLFTFSKKYNIYVYAIYEKVDAYNDAKIQTRLIRTQWENHVHMLYAKFCIAN